MKEQYCSSIEGGGNQGRMEVHGEVTPLLQRRMTKHPYSYEDYSLVIDIAPNGLGVKIVSGDRKEHG